MNSIGRKTPTKSFLEGVVCSAKLWLKVHFSSFPGFPPPAYVVPPPVAFSMSTGYTFPGGVSVPGTFLQPTAHSPAGNQVQGGKQSHIPYSQQRPSGPGPMTQGPQQTPPPSQQPLSSLPAQATAQSASQLQVQALAQQQQQQSPTKAVPGLGKSPPHHSGFQQVNLVCATCWALFKNKWQHSRLIFPDYLSKLSLKNFFWLWTSGQIWKWAEVWWVWTYDAVNWKEGMYWNGMSFLSSICCVFLI